MGHLELSFDTFSREMRAGHRRPDMRLCMHAGAAPDGEPGFGRFSGTAIPPTIDAPVDGLAAAGEWHAANPGRVEGGHPRCDCRMFRTLPLAYASLSPGSCKAKLVHFRHPCSGLNPGASSGERVDDDTEASEPEPVAVHRAAPHDGRSVQQAGTAARKLLDAPQDSPSKRLDLLAGGQTEHILRGVHPPLRHA